MKNISDRENLKNSLVESIERCINKSYAYEDQASKTQSRFEKLAIVNIVLLVALLVSYFFVDHEIRSLLFLVLIIWLLINPLFHVYNIASEHLQNANVEKFNAEILKTKLEILNELSDR